MLQYLDTAIALVVILLGMSLVITILTQMISAFLGYRGTNLLWGIRTLLKTLDPTLEEKAEEIATDVLQKPIISDSLFSKVVQDVPFLGWLMKRWKLATALTPQELVRSLSHMAQTMDKEDKTGNSIKVLLEQVDPEAARNAEMVLKTLQELSGKTASQMDKLVQELGIAMQGTIGKVESYFDAIMKRASQRFTTQMRIWTIVFAVLLAFGAQFDTIETLNKLWANPDLRSGLVSDRDSILKEASVVLSVQSGTARVVGPDVPSTILRSAMKTLKDTEKEATAGLGDPPEFANLDAALGWLQQNLNVNEDLKKKLAEKYRNLVLAELSARAATIRQDLEKSGFKLEIVPPWAALKKSLEWRRLLGLLITAGLLSLGAPFWFNVLRNLSNLRPLLANIPTKTGSTRS